MDHTPLRALPIASCRRTALGALFVPLPHHAVLRALVVSPPQRTALRAFQVPPQLRAVLRRTSIPLLLRTILFSASIPLLRRSTLRALKIPLLFGAILRCAPVPLLLRTIVFRASIPLFVTLAGRTIFLRAPIPPLRRCVLCSSSFRHHLTSPWECSQDSITLARSSTAIAQTPCRWSTRMPRAMRTSAAAWTMGAERGVLVVRKPIRGTWLAAPRRHVARQRRQQE